MPFVDLSTGARLHYDEINQEIESTPVILLHGMLGTPRTQLANVLDWLAMQEYHVYAPTLRGYGLSTPKPRDFPLRFYDRDAADVLAFMDALSIEKAHLIGYSDGGEITLICAGKAPNRFASAASWGAVGYFGPVVAEVAQRMIPGSSWVKPAEIELHGGFDPDTFAEEWVRATTHMVEMGGDVSVSLSRHITAPVLVMLGHQDTLNPANYAQNFLTGVKRGQLQMFDCGHPIHTQQPQAFFDALKTHLEAAS